MLTSAFDNSEMMDEQPWMAVHGLDHDRLTTLFQIKNPLGTKAVINSAEHHQR